MEDTQQLTNSLKDKLKPYETRIADLEAQETIKQAEIDTMKVLVRELHYLLDELKTDKLLNGKS